MRVTAQLVEAETGAHLWADKFDGDLFDVFDFQDQITERLWIVEPNVQKSELDRSRRKPPESLDAYDLYLRACLTSRQFPCQRRGRGGLLQKALKLEPNYAAAHAYVAWAHQIHFTHAGGFDEAEKIAALRHARAATAHDVDDATALAVGAMVLNHLGNDPKGPSTQASALCLRSVVGDRSLFWRRAARLERRRVTATAYADRALRLSPFDPLAYVAHVGLAVGCGPRRAVRKVGGAVGRVRWSSIPVWARSLWPRRGRWPSRAEWTEGKRVLFASIGARTPVFAFAPSSKRAFPPRLRIRLCVGGGCWDCPNHDWSTGLGMIRVGFDVLKSSNSSSEQLT